MDNQVELQDLALLDKIYSHHIFAVTAQIGSNMKTILLNILFLSASSYAVAQTPHTIITTNSEKIVLPDEALKTVKGVFKNDVNKTLNPALAAKLNTPVDVWKAELAKADTTNATARINAEVYYGLHYNLAFASMWNLNFSEAKKHMKVAKRLKKNNFYYFDYRKNIQTLETFLTNFEKLYLVNTKK